MRAAHLAKHPLCVMCEAEGRTEVATELDHIIPVSEGGSDNPDNVQGLCTKHHRSKTAKQSPWGGSR